MKKKIIVSLATVATLSLAACNRDEAADGNSPATAQSDAAKEAAGDKTIAAGLAADSKFMAAAKAAGLDQTLAGPGPYTVIVADNAAFDALPAGTWDGWMKPENRPQLTGLLTNMILSGTVLAEDISKAIDNGKGKAVLATISGGTVTATKEGDKIVLTDAAGKKATVTRADDKFSNGVVHHVDAILSPAAGSQAEG
jgi:uncharacterized surface protein with fasciclin (FAS1) repeats